MGLECSRVAVSTRQIPEIHVDTATWLQLHTKILIIGYFEHLEVLKVSNDTGISDVRRVWRFRDRAGR